VFGFCPVFLRPFFLRAISDFFLRTIEGCEQELAGLVLSAFSPLYHNFFDSRRKDSCVPYEVESPSIPFALSAHLTHNPSL